MVGGGPTPVSAWATAWAHHYSLAPIAFTSYSRSGHSVACTRVAGVAWPITAPPLGVVC